MAIQTGFQPEHTCTRDLSALASAQQVAEGSKNCYPDMPPGREAELILTTRVDGVSQQKLRKGICAAELRAHPEPKDKILNELHEIVDVQKKKLDIQERLIASLRERLDKSDTLSSLQQKKIDRLEGTIDQLNKEKLLQKKSFEEEIVQLKARNSQQQGEIDQLKNRISQLSAENLLQKESFEKEIGQLKEENLRLKKEIKQQFAESERIRAGHQEEIKQQFAESERRMAEQQEKIKAGHQEEMLQQFAESERIKAGHQEEMQRQFTESERRMAEQQEKIRAGHQEEIKQQFAESERRMAEQQEKIKAKHQEEIKQQFAESEKRMAELQKEIWQQLAESTKKQEELLTKMAAQEVRIRAEHQEEIRERKKENGFLHFGNLLLDSFEQYVQTLRLPSIYSLSDLINQEIKEKAHQELAEANKGLKTAEETGQGTEEAHQRVQEAHQKVEEANREANKWLNITVNGVFTIISRYHKSGVYFEAVCSALEKYPLISPVPGNSMEKKVKNLANFVTTSSQSRNVVAHQKDKEIALSAIDSIFEEYDDEWNSFINGIIRG